MDLLAQRGGQQGLHVLRVPPGVRPLARRGVVERQLRHLRAVPHLSKHSEYMSSKPNSLPTWVEMRVRKPDGHGEDRPAGREDPRSELDHAGAVGRRALREDGEGAEAAAAGLAPPVVVLVPTIQVAVVGGPHPVNDGLGQRLSLTNIECLESVCHCAHYRSFGDGTFSHERTPMSSQQYQNVNIAQMICNDHIGSPGWRGHHRVLVWYLWKFFPSNLRPFDLIDSKNPE
mmetsp:Transcript_1854/g.3109  ORF Transcript_1854/g.3109 Transcript_1854/m.3109 type:complete len:230 (+) Transcript_1854:209-898(+)